MRLVFFGLSLGSSWGNGHATTYRALLRGLAECGHTIDFFECEQPWYTSNQDLHAPEFCTLRFYRERDELRKWQQVIAAADAVVVGSFVPEAVPLIEWLDDVRRGLLCFYDIDTPVTLAKLAAGDCEYLSPAVMGLFDLYLSFSGGPVLRRLELMYNVRRAAALYCAVDTDLYRPVAVAQRWDLGYLGTYAPTRQAAVQRLLLDVATQLPDRRFVVAGSQYPADLRWPANVDRIDHLPPRDHADFYSSLGWTLNVTRSEMVALGYSPSVRLFEATACAAPVITDAWPGLDEVFTPGQELLTATETGMVIAALALPESRRRAIGDAGRVRALAQHSGAQRARELEILLRSCPRPAQQERQPAWN